MHIPQGMCAEMISEDEGQSREDLDRFGMWRMQKAVAADHKGWTADVMRWGRHRRGGRF